MPELSSIIREREAFRFRMRCVSQHMLPDHVGFLLVLTGFFKSRLADGGVRIHFRFGCADARFGRRDESKFFKIYIL